MKVSAPGKLVLTGAYAVLEGAPAVVVAVDRRAVADSERASEAPAAEVAAAFVDEAAAPPTCDVSSLSHEGQKLGLGSSAAAVVASVAAARAHTGADLADAGVRSDVFRRARAAHAAVQGWERRRRRGQHVRRRSSVHADQWRDAVDASSDVARAPRPPNVFQRGERANQRSPRARRRVPRREPVGLRHRHGGARGRSRVRRRALRGGSAGEIVAAVRAFGEALERLGDAADVPIVPVGFRRLATTAAEGGRGWFLPSGAGGGDVGVYLGVEPPPEAFIQLADRLGMVHLPIGIDPDGVRVH
ncbi:MAG: hypothetical protein U0235_17825 [Polyangiaceae bacterium]